MGRNDESRAGATRGGSTSTPVPGAEPSEVDARAARCAKPIADAVQVLGLRIRAGVHTGEVELDGRNVRGIAVHIGARVAALAGPSEVLVSSTVRDLVAGSGLAFEDAGEPSSRAFPGTGTRTVMD